jgi:hypothetical protein
VPETIASGECAAGNVSLLLVRTPDKSPTLYEENEWYRRSHCSKRSITTYVFMRVTANVSSSDHVSQARIPVQALPGFSLVGGV